MDFYAHQQLGLTAKGGKADNFEDMFRFLCIEGSNSIRDFETRLNLGNYNLKGNEKKKFFGFGKINELNLENLQEIESNLKAYYNNILRFKELALKTGNYADGSKEIQSLELLLRSLASAMIIIETMKKKKNYDIETNKKLNRLIRDFINKYKLVFSSEKIGLSSK